MSKQLKRYLASDVKTRLGDARDVVVVQVAGLTVEKSNDLRGKLRAEGATMTMLRNRVAMKAFEDLGMDGLGDVLEGMSAIAHGEGEETVLAVSRILADWTRANKAGGIKVLGGYMDGKVLEAEDVATLATLPTRDQLLAMIASAVVAPMQNIAGQVSEMLAGVARAVGALQEQRAEEGGSPEPEAATESTETAEPAADAEPGAAQENPSEAVEAAADDAAKDATEGATGPTAE